MGIKCVKFTFTEWHRLRVTHKVWIRHYSTIFLYCLEFYSFISSNFLFE